MPELLIETLLAAVAGGLAMGILLVTRRRLRERSARRRRRQAWDDFETQLRRARREWRRR
jgi:uncharacterized integral membrane protein